MAALPIFHKRYDAQSIAPFWISTIACVALLIGGIALAIFLYSCVKIKKRWRRRTLVGEAHKDIQEKFKDIAQSEAVVAAGQRTDSGVDPITKKAPMNDSTRENDGEARSKLKNAATMHEIDIADTQRSKSEASKKQSPPPPLLNSWKSSALASLKRKSVASIQWVGFHGQMDRRSQTLQVSIANKS